MSIYENANFIQFPDGGIPSGLVPVKPEDNASNFDFARNSNASRVNKDKLIDEKSADEIRFDYTFASCPDILTEPQSTNLITYSEDFSDSSWDKNGTVSVLANQSISPDGLNNATNLSGATGDALTNVLRETFFGLSNPASFSVYPEDTSK